MQEQSPTTETRAAIDPPSGETRKTVWEKPVAVFLLSLVFAGLGQVVNREPWKGLGFAISAPLFAILTAWTGAYRTFWGLVASVVFVLGWRIWICVDAFRVARQRKASEISQSHSMAVLLLCGGLVLGAAFLASTDYLAHASLPFRAFKTASASFCPTLCEGERFVVDVRAFRTNRPKRGDVIAFDFQGQHQPLFVKRIVGVEGDVVSEKNGAVFVNGNPYTPNEATRHCGRTPTATGFNREEPRFSPVTVPPGSFFVMGDNTTNSFDSRFEGFGFVTLNQIAGKLMYMYWSPERTRIGCAIE